ncbi:phosphatase PAP2 family protein [Aestuariibius insulae]|uniref:phosphatase PAP2 family protein n=1 Tax=Aestuariibius insulae TaxID=2058287 RepID=UPI00345E73AB
MDAGPRSAVLDGEMARLLSLDVTAMTTADVKASLLGNTTLVELIRPDFDNDFLKDQMPYLRSYADLRLDRTAEITIQTGDVLSFFGAISYLDPEATKRSLELIGALFRSVNVNEMRLKLHFDLPRPITVAQEVQPMIQTPGHPSWPSGHATEAFAIATVLSALKNGGSVDGFNEVSNTSFYMRLAQRIAANRTVAGVHYPSDSMCGAILGITIGEMLVNMLEGEAKTPTRKFDGSDFTGDFDLTTLKDTMQLGAGTEAIPGGLDLGLLSPLWAIAKTEW